MPKAGFEPTITASKRSKTVHASDRSATATGAQIAWSMLSITYSLPSRFSRVRFEESTYALCQGFPVSPVYVVFPLIWLPSLVCFLLGLLFNPEDGGGHVPPKSQGSFRTTQRLNFRVTDTRVSDLTSNLAVCLYEL
jgi:hypothetical protein